MPRSIQPRRLRRPTASRRPPAGVRVSDLVLAVAVVAILASVCLVLLVNLVGTTGGLAAAPTSATVVTRSVGAIPAANPAPPETVRQISPHPRKATT